MADVDQTIILINQAIPQDILPAITDAANTHILHHALDDYEYIQQLLLQHNNRRGSLEIYDITHCDTLLYGQVIPVRDHINRIGSNPLIGKQKFFDIDFIDISTIYQTQSQGIVTNSCGAPLPSHLSYPSTFLANIAILGFVYKYTINAYLINISP